MDESLNEVTETLKFQNRKGEIDAIFVMSLHRLRKISVTRYRERRCTDSLISGVHCESLGIHC